MKKLFPFFKPYKKQMILAPLFKLLEVCFELLVPLVVAQIIDVGIAKADVPFIISRCLILLALGAVGLISAVTAQFFAAKAAVGCTASIRHALFEHIGTLSYSDIDRLGSSTLVTRMTSDTAQVQTGINLTLRLILRSPFVVIGAMIMAFTVDPSSATVVAVSIPILAIVIFFVMLYCIPLYKRVQTQLDSITARTRQNLTGVRVIRAFCKEEDELARFCEQNDALTGSQKRVGRISALLNPLSYAIVNVAIVVLIYVGALRVNSGKISQGEVVALYNYMSQILVELIKFATLIITLTKSIACAKRLDALLSCESSMRDGTLSGEEADTDTTVCFDNVSMRYEGSSDNALQGISFTAKRGETIGVIGGTGSGKSTLIHLIPRFYDACEGRVSVCGHPVTAWSQQALREQIGIVPQKAVLFSGTVRDNLLWGNQNADEQQLYQALKVAQAQDFVLESEDGLDHRVEQLGRNFSGGQRQRLTIARALVRQPRILILDDSSSALDYVTDAALRRAIAALPSSPTVFIVSQRTASVRHADRILVLEDGRLVGNGTHEQLLEECAEYREIHQSQFKKEDA